MPSSLGTSRKLRIHPAVMVLACLGGGGDLSAEPASRFSHRTAPLIERFVNPPAADRVLKIIHGWPDDPAAQDQLRERLLDQGFGGVVCNVSHHEYLESEPRWKALHRAVTKAREAGMALWLYDERGYPSGNAGGLVLRDHPEDEAEGLLIADTQCGPGPVTVTVPPGRLILAAAFRLDATSGSIMAPNRDPASSDPPPKRLELPAPVDGRIAWEAPAGRWQLLVVTHDRLYAGTHAEGNLAEKMPYVNLLRAEPTKRFLELTHGRYAQHFGDNLSRWFDATFTDEPSLMSLFLRRMPYRPLPWAPELPAEFRRRRGYELEPIIPDLALASGGPEAARHRHDYWLTIGELVSANYFGQIEDWCREHRLPSGGHLLAEEDLLNHVPLYGDFFRCVRRMGAPSIDCLTSVPAEVPWHIARLVASAAELEGRELVMCETSDHGQVWRPPGDTRPKRIVSEAEIRGTANRLLVAGVNTFTSYYSFTDLSDDALRRLNDWVGRCATLLRGGHQVADVAVVYPVESVWTKFIPAAQWAQASPQANRIGNLYRTAVDALFEARRDFTVIDSRTLVEAVLDGDSLVHGPLRWHVIVLPGVDTLPWAAWQNLERFARQGGTVILLGARPLNTEREFPSAAARELGDRLLGPAGDSRVQAVGEGRGIQLTAGAAVLLPALLDQVIEPDVALTDPEASIRVTHRRIDGREVYFLVNDSPTPWRGEVSVSASGAATIWDLAEGTSRALAAADSWTISLADHGAIALTFAKDRPRQRRELAPGPVSAPHSKPLVMGGPSESHGEFVRATLEPDPRHGTAEKPAWRAQATLTRDRVDTFLFVRLPVATPGQLDDAGMIEIETWVPEGQRAPAQLLLILHEADGADYLAESPRSMGVSGPETLFLPLSRFQLAGWSQDANGRLDRARISEVRIGWGGYYGTTGEEVTFSFGVPRFGHRRLP